MVSAVPLPPQTVQSVDIRTLFARKSEEPFSASEMSTRSGTETTTCSDGHGSTDSPIDLCSDPAVDTGSITENTSHYEIGTNDNNIVGQPKRKIKRIDENQDEGIMQISGGQNSEDKEAPWDSIKIIEACEDHSNHYQETSGNRKHVTTSHSEESVKQLQGNDSNSLANLSRDPFLV